MSTSGHCSRPSTGEPSLSKVPYWSLAPPGPEKMVKNWAHCKYDIKSYLSLMETMMDDDEGLTFALSSQSLIARIAEKAGSASKASASSRVIGPPSKQSSSSLSSCPSRSFASLTWPAKDNQYIVINKAKRKWGISSSYRYQENGLSLVSHHIQFPHCINHDHHWSLIIIKWTWQTRVPLLASDRRSW